MASRPAWSYREDKNRVVQAIFEFQWNSGLSVSQKKKNVAALHQVIRADRKETALEISTRSDVDLGVRLSAFNLKLEGVPLENIFQSSKVFRNGGPYTDLLDVSPKDAKRDERLRSSGELTGFRWQGQDWPLLPRTAFYDYIYCNAVRAALTEENVSALQQYTWYTDIEFNPKKSLNTQARSVAIYRAIIANDQFEVLEDPQTWWDFHRRVVFG